MRPKQVAVKPAPPAEPLIELSELTVNFGRQPVLRDISLVIPRGQTIAIIGESGCGKTVLLKHIIGLLFPSSGHVVFDGQRIDSLNDKELTALRGRFGFLFQNAALFDSMTVADNIAFPLKESSKHTAREDWPDRCRTFEASWPAQHGARKTAGPTIGRHAKARGPGSCAGHESRSAAVRRTHDRSRPDRERRHQ